MLNKDTKLTNSNRHFLNLNLFASTPPGISHGRAETFTRFVDALFCPFEGRDPPFVRLVDQLQQEFAHAVRFAPVFAQTFSEYFVIQILRNHRNDQIEAVFVKGVRCWAESAETRGLALIIC